MGRSHHYGHCVGHELIELAGGEDIFKHLFNFCKKDRSNSKPQHLLSRPTSCLPHGVEKNLKKDKVATRHRVRSALSNMTAFLKLNQKSFYSLTPASLFDGLDIMQLLYLTYQQ